MAFVVKYRVRETTTKTGIGAYTDDNFSVYPASGAQINSLGTNVAFTVYPGGVTEFFTTTTTQWYSIGPTGWGGF